MVPMNFLRENDTAAYTDTGLWAAMAAEEAAKIGEVNMVGSSRDNGYKNIPKNIKVPARSRYLHLTTNNTIYGTQWNELPKTNVPLVADMSSDILGREMDYSAFDLIYAVAQKNIGIAGATLVVVKDSFLKKANKDLPGYLSYANHVKAGGLYNTVPVFNIYVSMLMLEWIKEQGGVKAMHKLNEAKSQLMYNTLDQLPFVDMHAAKADRSMMNVVFDIKEKGMKDELLRFLEREKIEGVEGHRSVGGFRVSLYNGVEMRSVETLAQCLNEFALKKA
jgi:phosphoserine aminotransferase